MQYNKLVLNILFIKLIKLDGLFENVVFIRYQLIKIICIMPDNHYCENQVIIEMQFCYNKLNLLELQKILQYVYTNLFARPVINFTSLCEIVFSEYLYIKILLLFKALITMH